MRITATTTTSTRASTTSARTTTTSYPNIHSHINIENICGHKRLTIQTGKKLVVRLTVLSLRRLPITMPFITYWSYAGCWSCYATYSTTPAPQSMCTCITHSTCINWSVILKWSSHIKVLIVLDSNAFIVLDDKFGSSSIFLARALCNITVCRTRIPVIGLKKDGNKYKTLKLCLKIGF